jgi:glycosyl transferase family 25
MEGIDAIVYINLNKREDRRKEMEEMFSSYGLQAERVEAIEKKPGIVGCGYSHLKALKLAQSKKYKNVLILEDDFEFIVPKEELLEEIKKLKTISYDVVMLSYNIVADKPYNTFLRKVIDASTASGYLVHSRFYNNLISLYSKYIPILEKTGKHHMYANDQIWKLLQPTSNWFAFQKRLGKQRPGFSDNTEKFEDYKC